MNDRHSFHDGHHHIGQDGGDFTLVLGVDGQGVRSIGSSQDSVAKGLQSLAGDREDGGFVVDHQDCFALSTLQAELCGLPLPHLGGRFHGWQVNLESRASAGFAVHIDDSIMTLHDGHHGRKPQSSSFVEFLGGEEGLENFIDNTGGHARARVGNADPDVTPGLGLSVHDGVVFIQHAVFGTDRQLASVRHRVPGVHTKV